MMNLFNKGPFQIPQNISSNNISGPYESYKTNLISKERLMGKRNNTGSSNGEIEIPESKKNQKI